MQGRGIRSFITLCSLLATLSHPLGASTVASKAAEAEHPLASKEKSARDIRFGGRLSSGARFKCSYNAKDPSVVCLYTDPNGEVDSYRRDLDAGAVAVAVGSDDITAYIRLVGSDCNPEGSWRVVMDARGITESAPCASTSPE